MNKSMEYREVIVELVKIFSFETYVEVGTFLGDTIGAVAPYVKRSVGVDTRKKPNLDIEYYQMSSAEFSKIWNDPIDLLLIDADHSEQAVWQDFSSLSRFVKPYTGLILLHDTYPIKPELFAGDRCGTAWKAAKKIKELQDFEFVTLPGPWAGLSIIRKTPLGKYGWMEE